MYTEALNTSLEATGTVEKQNEIYMDSWAAKIKQLQTAGDDLTDSLINSDFLKGLTDFGTGFLSVLASIVDGLGGVKTSLLGLATVATNLFDKQLNSLVLTFVNNWQAAKSSIADNAALKSIVSEFEGLSDVSGNLLTIRDDLVQLQSEANNYASVMNDADRNIVKSLIN